MKIKILSPIFLLLIFTINCQQVTMPSGTFYAYNISNMNYINLYFLSYYSMYSTVMTNDQFNTFKNQSIFTDLPYNNTPQFNGYYIQCVVQTTGYNYYVIMNKATQKTTIDITITPYTQKTENNTNNDENNDKIDYLGVLLLFGFILLLAFISFFLVCTLSTLYNCVVYKKRTKFDIIGE